jgi:1,4-alpha-glucan branching enzyme
LTDSGLSDFDLHLFGEGRHERIYDKLGAHASVGGAAPRTRFAVWAPNAERVSVVGAFNRWDGDAHVMQSRASSGIWELSIAGIGAGTAYKYEIRARPRRPSQRQGRSLRFAMQLRPDNCSVVASLGGYGWQDSQWLAQRERRSAAPAVQRLREVHLGSWRRPWTNARRLSPSWRRGLGTADPYVVEMGYTHSN